MRRASWAVLTLLAATLVARIVFASRLGLGVDASYTVATGRQLQFGFFDHPPAAWWLVWGARRLFATENAVALRLPFILLFALTTWLMYRLTTRLFDEEAGLWAAATLNFALVIAWTSGTWILPDGPLNAAMMAGANAAALALYGATSMAPFWWVAAGACGGLALLSKFHGAFLFVGIGLFLVTCPTHRRWLLTPWPYAGAIVAIALFLPVIVWNEQHGWVTFAFQGSRARLLGISLWGPLAALVGQALFLLPWVWLWLVVCLAKAIAGGPADDRRWMLVCLAAVPIIGFTAVGLTGTRVLYHWAAPGYLMLFPLLGAEVAAAMENQRRHVRTWLVATASSLAVVLSVVIAMAQLPWPVLRLPGGKSIPYPLLESVDWSGLKTTLERRGFADRPNLFRAATRWHEAGKIGYALGGKLPVVCLCRDPRNYGVLTRPERHVGEDALIIGRNLAPERIRATYAAYFQKIEELPPITMGRGGSKDFELSIYLGHALSASMDAPGLLDPLLLGERRRQDPKRPLDRNAPEHGPIR